MTIQCTFYPQAWQNDYAIPVDAEGPVTWTTNWPDDKPLPANNDMRATSSLANQTHLCGFKTGPDPSTSK